MRSISLKEHTSMEMGGVAPLIEINTIDDALNLKSVLNNKKYFVLGKGCNLLVADKTHEAVCLKINLKGIKISEAKDSISATVAAGEDFDELTKTISEIGLTGVELLAGIPGLVGASPIQNIGAYGSEVSDFINSLKCLCLETNEIEIFTKDQCLFEYRKSIFNSDLKGKYIILEIDFEFPKLKKLKLEHRDIVSKLSDDFAYSGIDLRNAIIEIRENKGMMIGDKNPKSAGSFFKNPVVDLEHFNKIKEQYPNIPSFNAPDGVKIPAAWLIGESGYEKGHRHKGVGISPYHNLSLINVNSGNFKELMELASLIQGAVLKKFNIHLAIEPEIIE